MPVPQEISNFLNQLSADDLFNCLDELCDLAEFLLNKVVQPNFDRDVVIQWTLDDVHESEDLERVLPPQLLLLPVPSLPSLILLIEQVVPIDELLRRIPADYKDDIDLDDEDKLEELQEQLGVKSLEILKSFCIRCLRGDSVSSDARIVDYITTVSQHELFGDFSAGKSCKALELVDQTRV
ncbi:hypothetical protein GEMRC1_000629 [Eukaryota sp. GEM-RC1]